MVGWDHQQCEAATVIADDVEDVFVEGTESVEAHQVPLKGNALRRRVPGGERERIADLVAYTAYISTLREPAKMIMWDWFPELLGPTSSAGKRPLEL